MPREYRRATGARPEASEIVGEVQRSAETVVILRGADIFIKIRDQTGQQQIGGEILVQLVTAQEIDFPQESAVVM